MAEDAAELGNRKGPQRLEGRLAENNADRLSTFGQSLDAASSEAQNARNSRRYFSADIIAAAERWDESADKNKEADRASNDGRLFYSESIQFSVESLPKSRLGARGVGGEAVARSCKICAKK